MKLILFGFIACVVVFSIKSETQSIEYDKLRDVVREEMQNLYNPKILQLESIVMTMNAHMNRLDEQNRNQEEHILDLQRRLNDQDIQIGKHDQQINEAVEYISMLEEKAINEMNQKQLVGVHEMKRWKHTEPRYLRNISSHSFIDFALRQSIKYIPEKNGNKKKGHSLTKRLGFVYQTDINDSIIAFYSYMSNGDNQPEKHQILVFDIVKTNIGLSYNKHTGTFTAPYNGVYVFIWTVATCSHSFVYTQLVVNSYPFGAIFTDSDEIGDYHTSTGSVVAALHQGDVVYIRTHPTDPIKGCIWSHDNFRTYFNGWKL